MAYVQHFDGHTEPVEDVVEEFGADGEPTGRTVTAKVVTAGSVTSEPSASDVAKTK